MYTHAKIQHESSRGTPQAAETLVCGSRHRNGRSNPALDRRISCEEREKAEVKITAWSGQAAGYQPTASPNPAFLTGGSMAARKSTIKTATRKRSNTRNIEDRLRAIHYRNYGAYQQLQGLQTCLNGLGEAAGHGSTVIQLSDMTVGFGYLLNSVVKQVEETQRFIVDTLNAEKGGAE
jgi:hypothetical protein